jgi:hypothetical protein
LKVRSYYLDEKVIDRIKLICKKQKVSASYLLDVMSKRYLNEMLLEDAENDKRVQGQNKPEIE